ncbi:MAG TPA: hypothetical protein VES20_15030 [Bryobacteraceae bacterium]|nr:hypothetical protein [Bryobacteraceae bacterium]
MKNEAGGTHVTVGSVLTDIVRDPVRHLVKRWNWKSAVTSALMRGAIFFAANWSAGLNAAVGAMLTEFAWRTAVSGFYGSITQSFRKAEPAWAAALFVMLLLPLSSHALEFAIHFLRGTPNLLRSVAASMIFTAIGTAFNLYAMRRGVLVVDEEQRPFLQDMKAMPQVIGGFLAAGPLALWRLGRARR